MTIETTTTTFSMGGMPLNAEGEFDLTGFPPSPVLWATGLVDTLCAPLRCGEWRDWLGIAPDSWLGAKVPPLFQYLPSQLSYADFLQQQQQEAAALAFDDDATATMTTSLQSMYKYAFETNSTALGDLGTPTAALLLILLVLCFRSVKLVLLPTFSSLGRLVGRRTHGEAWEAANEERIYKFGEYVYRLLYHSAISIYGVWYFWDKEWWKAGGTASLFVGFPYQPVEPGMAWYYLLQAAYNLDAMLSLLLISFSVQIRSPFVKKIGTASRGLGGFQFPITIGWSDTVRGDFQEMMIHHIVTNLLVIGSSCCRVTRVGSMVFLVHDISDVPVDISKLFNFLKWKWTTLNFFFLMVGVWMVTRLYVLPFTIYRSILTESHYTLEQGMPVLLYVYYRQFFYVLVGLLILLHLAWFIMFVQIFGTFLKKNECHDLSEHKEGEEQGSIGSAGSDDNEAPPPKLQQQHQTFVAKTPRPAGEVAEEKKDN